VLIGAGPPSCLAVLPLRAGPDFDSAPSVSFDCPPSTSLVPADTHDSVISIAAHHSRGNRGPVVVRAGVPVPFAWPGRFFARKHRLSMEFRHAGHLRRDRLTCPVRKIRVEGTSVNARRSEIHRRGCALAGAARVIR
jgi:hypothetical protein